MYPTGIAVANILNKAKKEKATAAVKPAKKTETPTKPVKKMPSVVKPVNMGPASSAAEAYRNLYTPTPPMEVVEKQTTPVEKQNVEKQKLFTCDYCNYETPYRHNKIRHEYLVHAVVRQPVQQRPLKKPADVKKPSVLLAEKQSTPPPAPEKKPEVGKKRKIEASPEITTTTKKDVQTETISQKKVKLDVVESDTESSVSSIEEEPEEEKKPVTGEEMKYVKIEDGGIMVFYANEVMIHVCPAVRY